jgi:zinc transport system permease protein
MDLTPLLDPIFLLPFAVGLLLAAVLPLLGALLVLRDEWLAALGYAHLAAAGALLGLAGGLSAVAGGLVAAAGGAVAKGVGSTGSTGSTGGNAVYAFMILGGWAALLLIAANTAVGEQLGHALMEGQLYFAGPPDLAAAASLALAVALALPVLLPRLLRARLLPQQDAANRRPVRRWHTAFDLLAAAGMAVGTASMGVMAAFALVLLPAWLAFRLAPSWRLALWQASAFAVLAYLGAFAGALVLDQPFGPVLVAVLLAAVAASLRPRRQRVHPSAAPRTNPDLNGDST